MLRDQKGTTMVNLDSLDVHQLEQLRDAVNRRLLQMRQTRGLSLPELLRLLEEVKTVLNEQGKQWRSLERWQWMDGKICFWLNPTDQILYQPGWYSIDDLISWTHNHGPVMVPFEDEDEEELEAGTPPSWNDDRGVTITWLPDTSRQQPSSLH